MKQTTFAKSLGIAQQNVSKMENKKEISIEKLEAAAKVLGLTVDAIEKFNEKNILNNNIALEQGPDKLIMFIPLKKLFNILKMSF